MKRGTIKQSEKMFQKALIEYARMNGWLVAHFTAVTDSRGFSRTPVQADGSGFPDLVLVRRERLAFAELKSDTGRLGEEQVKWIQALAMVGHSEEADRSAWSIERYPIEVYIWKPKDWPTIELTLA